MLSSGKTSTDVRAETWASKKAQENKVVVAEMRMQCYDVCAVQSTVEVFHDFIFQSAIHPFGHLS